MTVNGVSVTVNSTQFNTQTKISPQLSVVNSGNNGTWIDNLKVTALPASGSGSIWNITGANSGNVAGLNFSSFENLTGSSAADTFTFATGASLAGTLSGGSGINTVTIAGSHPAFTVYDGGTSASDTINLTFWSSTWNALSPSVRTAIQNYAANPTGQTLNANNTLGLGFSASNFEHAVLTINQPAVTLTNPGNRTSVSGDAVNLALAASATDSYPLTYSAAGLPAGLSINSSTGVISGTLLYSAASTDPYVVTVTATNAAAGVSASQTFTWTVQANPAPITPQITLTTEVLSGHQVRLSGQVTDLVPGGVVVTFSGAVSGTVTTDASGHFSFITSNASLGTVYAVGVDQDQASTNTASAVIADSAPILNLSIAYGSGTSVTLSGELEDLDEAGVTIQFQGMANGSVVTDADGKFSFTTNASALGSIQAFTADVWGQASNVAEVDVASDAPVITNFCAIQELGNTWTFEGEVTGDNTVGMTVNFGGLLSLMGLTATVGSDGSFYLTCTLEEGECGTATARTSDVWGTLSNLALFVVR